LLVFLTIFCVVKGYLASYAPILRLGNCSCIHAVVDNEQKSRTIWVADSFLEIILLKLVSLGSGFFAPF